jgi:hypothetical protein
MSWPGFYDHLFTRGFVGIHRWRSYRNMDRNFVMTIFVVAVLGLLVITWFYGGLL